MTPRQKRMATVAAILVGVGIATAFALQAFEKNMLYYYSPTQILAGEAPDTRSIRVGGLVENGSVQREPGSLEVRFTLTDFANTVGVSYTGVLPDLFREGQGIIARGKLTDQRHVRRRGSPRQARRELHAARGEGQPEAACGRRTGHEPGRRHLSIARTGRGESDGH
jgi:cytochrome c-type biogenesis protein CcmE